MKRTPSTPPSPRRIERTVIERRGDTAIHVRVIEYGPSQNQTRPQRRAA
jgi:hypothetical protein